MVKYVIRNFNEYYVLVYETGTQKQTTTNGMNSTGTGLPFVGTKGFEPIVQFPSKSRTQALSNYPIHNKRSSKHYYNYVVNLKYYSYPTKKWEKFANNIQ